MHCQLCVCTLRVYSSYRGAQRQVARSAQRHTVHSACSAVLPPLKQPLHAPLATAAALFPHSFWCRTYLAHTHLMPTLPATPAAALQLAGLFQDVWQGLLLPVSSVERGRGVCGQVLARPGVCAMCVGGGGSAGRQGTTWTRPAAFTTPITTTPKTQMSAPTWSLQRPPPAGPPLQ